MVHPAVLDGTRYLARCGEPLPVSQVEVERDGMPCMKCAALLSLVTPVPALHGPVGGVVDAA